MNWGNLAFNDHAIEPRYKLWMDKVSELFGGLDMFALDVMHGKDGKEWIIEVNDSSFGLMSEYEENDKKIIRDLAIKKLSEFIANSSPNNINNNTTN